MDALCQLRDYGAYIASAYGISALVVAVIAATIWRRKVVLDRRMADLERASVKDAAGGSTSE